MAQNLKVCEVDDELKSKLKSFRFRKATNNAAIIMKIDREALKVMVDEELEDCSVDELVAALPDHQPRYVVYSYKYAHDDGRVSYPMCFIFISPQGCKPEQQMMYAGSKTSLVNETGMTKVYELRSLDELTEEWLVSKLQKL